MKNTKKLVAVVLSLCMVLSLIPIVALQASAFSADNFKAQIKKVSVGAPITGSDGKKYLPVDVHIFAAENLSDSDAVYFLEGYLKATLADGTTSESIRSLGMTLMGPLKPDVTLDSNMWNWEWTPYETGGGQGVIKYNVPLLDNDETQTVEKSDATGLNEVNGLKEGDKFTLQNETVVNTNNMPSDFVTEVFPNGPSVFSDEVTIPIENLKNYPKSYEIVAYDTTEPETEEATEPATVEATEFVTENATEPATAEATELLTEPATVEATAPETVEAPTAPANTEEVVVNPTGEVTPTQPESVAPTNPGEVVVAPTLPVDITPTYPVVIDPTNPGGGTVTPTQPPEVTPTTPITTDPVSNITTIQAKAPKTTLKIGETTKINVDVKYGAGETKFTSETPKVVSVSKDGTVKGLSAGKGYVLVENNGAKQRIGFNINKKSNTMTVKAKTVKAKADKKTAIKRSKAIKIKKAKGKLSFKKIKGNKKIKVNKKTGKITVKKGLKKGKIYKVKIKVTAKGNAIYAGMSKTVAVKIKIK